MASKQSPPLAESYTRPTQAYTLASGRPVAFVQPDLFDLASGQIDLPNAAKLDIWHLLYRAGQDDPQQQLLSDERYARSLYYCAQLVISPRVKLDEDDMAAVIDRKELSLSDLLAAYTFLRYGPPKIAARTEPEPAQNTPLSGDGVPPESE